MNATYNEKVYWESRYASRLHSGEGSRGVELDFKLRFLQQALVETDSVIDLGHGDGELSFAIAQMVHHYKGYDISETAVLACRQRAASLVAANVEFECCDISDVQNTLADVVLCVDVLFHMPSKAKFDDVVANICRSFSRIAILTVWKRSIVDARKGQFAAHNNYFELDLPEDCYIAVEADIEGNPHKQMLIIKRKI